MVKTPYTSFTLALMVGLFLLSKETFSQDTESKNQHILTVKGELFYVDNRPFDMWGIRVASASQSEELTDHLIAQLDDYAEHGVNTITLFLQGSSGGFSDPFLDNGKQVKPDHLSRVKRIISACNERDMVVIMGIFYQRTMADMNNDLNIFDASGVKNAVETVARELKEYKNIILNIANEQNSSFYRKCEFFDFNDPQKIIGLCEVAKTIAPQMLVGAGGYHDDSNVIIGKSTKVDVLLFDTFDGDVENGHHSKWHYDYFKSQGVPEKPVVNVEIFGGWTRKFMPPGVYPEDGQQKHLQDIEEAAAIPGLYVFFHSNPWCQGVSVGMENRFDLGGRGTEQEPGIRWWFEHVRDHVQTNRK